MEPEHLDVATSLNNLAGLYWVLGDIARVIEFIARGSNIEQHNPENALKALHGSRILHLATHGFFLEDQPTIPTNRDRRLAVMSNPILLG